MTLEQQINTVKQCRRALFADIPDGLDPTFYQTGTRVGDEAVQRQLDAAIESLERMQRAIKYMESVRSGGEFGGTATANRVWEILND
jgi:hypothetical protein